MEEIKKLSDLSKDKLKRKSVYTIKKSARAELENEIINKIKKLGFDVIDLEK